MGNRSRIVVISKDFASPIHLYGHWAGEANAEAVKTVLAMPEARIGDPSYLTAQLLHAFTQIAGYDGVLGFGIGAYNDDDSWDDNPQIVVNADTGQVYGDVPAEFASAATQ